MLDLHFDLAYPKKLPNEPEILALFIKLQFVVEEQDKGEFKAEWSEIDTYQHVDVTMTFENESLQETVDSIVDDLEVLLNEDNEVKDKEQTVPAKEEKVDDDVKGDKDDEERKYEAECDDYRDQDYYPGEPESITSNEMLTLCRTEYACPAMEGEPASDAGSEVQSSGSSWRRLSGSDDSTSQESDSQDVDSTMGVRKSVTKRGKELKNGKKDSNYRKKKAKIENLGQVLESDKEREGKTKLVSSPGPQAVKTRRNIPCPMPWCSSNVIHLPRHMRTVHKWTKEAASKVLLKYNIRKAKNPESSEKSKDDKEARKSPKKEKKRKKDYHRRRHCPVDMCHSIVRRLPAHLHKIHKMSTSSEAYRQALSTAPCVRDRKHSIIRLKEFVTKKRQSEAAKGPADSDSEGDVMEHSLEAPMQPMEDSVGKLSEDLLDDPMKGPDEGAVGNVVDSPVEDSIRNPIFRQFENWLQSPDGGKRDAKTAKQHSSQLATILDIVDETCDVQSLLDIKLVRQLFLKKYVEFKKYEAATIKSYLMSLRHFFSFLLSDVPEEVSFDPQNVAAMSEKVHMWSLSYKRESCTRRWKKLEEDSWNQLTPADIQCFEKSEASREAVKLLGQYSDPVAPVEVTQRVYTLVRDFLFSQILIDNASRPGVLSYMMIEEIKRMQQEGEEWVVAVMKHKTVHIHGPAYVVLSNKLKSWLSIFVNKMRAQVTTSKTGHVFLSWNGKYMTSGQINKALQSVFKKAQVDVKVTSTSFRKSAVTAVHQRNPELSGKLASLMAHNESTAKKYYLLSEKTKVSVEASKKLRHIMRNKEIVSIQESRDFSESHEKPSGSVSKLDDKKRLPWTPEEVQKVLEAFKDEIQRKEVTINIVREKIASQPKLSGMSLRRVYDRLRKELCEPVAVSSPAEEVPPIELESLEQRVDRMTAHSSQETSLDAYDEQSSISIVPPTQQSSNVFLDGDISALRSLFADMISNKPILQVEIKRRCGNCADGKRLLKKYTVVQLTNRIKYERKMKRNQKQ